MGRRVVAVLAVVVACALATGCTGGGSGTPATSGPAGGSTGGDGGVATAPAGPAYAPGCSARSRTDLADLRPDRPLARCDAGSPPARPVAPRRPFTVCAPAGTTRSAPLVLGVARGTFAAEGLDVVVRPGPAADCYPLLAAGRIDAVLGGLDVSLYDQIGRGANLRLVLGATVDAPDARTGLWANPRCPGWNGAAPQLQSLRGRSVGVPAGPGSSTTAGVGAVLAGAGLSPADVNLRATDGSGGAVRDLAACAVDAAWLTGAEAARVGPDPVPPRPAPGPAAAAGTAPASTLPPAAAGFVRLASPVPEPVTGYVLGPSVLGADRAAATAFVRAYLRSVDTWFAADYRDDAGVLAAVAQALDADVADLLAEPPVRFDVELRAGTATRAQATFAALGYGNGRAPLAEDQVVDRSLLDAAVSGR